MNREAALWMLMTVNRPITLVQTEIPQRLFDGLQCNFYHPSIIFDHFSLAGLCVGGCLSVSFMNLMVRFGLI